MNLNTIYMRKQANSVTAIQATPEQQKKDEMKRLLMLGLGGLALGGAVGGGLYGLNKLIKSKLTQKLLTAPGSVKSFTAPSAKVSPTTTRQVILKKNARFKI